jgi:uncharacterized protein (DUF1501 family)
MASMTRRELLQRAALLAGSGILLRGPAAWAARSSEAGERQQRLIVIFLRGAVDGLSVVIPYGDPRYYTARPTIALPRPGSAGGILALDSHFGLHPALESILPFWRDGTLAFVHACGSPDSSRSHFEAQDYMESGTPGVKSTPDGWMNRLLAVFPGAPAATAAVSVGPTVPRILSGRMPVTNVSLGRGAARPLSIERPWIARAFNRLYQGTDPLSSAYQQGQAAHQHFEEELTEERQAADNGAPSPTGFGNDATQLARLLRKDSTIRLVFLALSGWDTHVNQGGSNGYLASHLRLLGAGIKSLVDGLGATYADTLISVISEFGRTVRENGNVGTDHGHGTVLWLFGGKVRGRTVYGRWPGLADVALYQGRDLAVTTDFREVLSVMLRDHFGLNPRQVATVFPQAPVPSESLRGLMRG